jgi:unsaturated chondroitin disaccharide hydrolase
MRKLFYAITVFVFAFKTLNAQQSEKEFVKENFEFAARQTKNMLRTADQSKPIIPHSMRKDGSLISGSIYNWTSGFFPGTLWYLSEYVGDAPLKDSALHWTKKLEPVQTFTDNHDIGFMMYCSYGNAYRITKNEAYKNILVQSAKSLVTRFNKRTGSIQSWNSFFSWHGDKKYNFPVIIDNMMNLELLFFASKVTGNNQFRNIAVTHAENVMKNQIRKDYSSFHIIYYDTATGKPIKGETSQGYADNSTWARGQSWGIYGFTLMYRETGDARFLKTAQGMANYYLDHKYLPSDKVPYWDFNANQNGYKPGTRSNASKVPVNYRDASAAAVTASALFELSTYSKGTVAKKYFEAGKKIVHTLSSPAYRATEGTNANFILMHSVGSIPHNSEIDVPLVYADYYYIEALKRYNQLIEEKPLFEK